MKLSTTTFVSVDGALLELKEVRVANMLPALVVAPLIVAAAPLWPL